jgi:hypothetical protein
MSERRRIYTKKLIVSFLKCFIKAPKNEIIFQIFSAELCIKTFEAEDKGHGQTYKTSALCFNFMYFMQKRHKKGLYPKLVSYVIYQPESRRILKTAQIGVILTLQVDQTSEF